ncbi:hypothetical protein [Streptomyces sp. NBC_01506]|uniref:hypothetical protein n=1 Tax=Streptomyces sp. NBC_01506 TaxID=2903887 RepID=UPI0038645AF5
MVFLGKTSLTTAYGRARVATLAEVRRNSLSALSMEFRLRAHLPQVMAWEAGRGSTSKGGA